MNQAAERFFGYSADELLGSSVFSLYDHSFQQLMQLQWQHLEEKRKAYFLAVCRHKHGEPFVCGWHLQFEQGDGEQNGRVLALISPRDMFKELARHAPLGIALVNHEGRLIFASDALCTMLGYQTDELCRMRFTEFTHPDDAEADWQLFQELLRGQRRSCAVRKRYLRKDGQLVHALLAVCLLDAEPKGMVLGMAADMTKQVLAEQHVQQQNEQLRLFKKALESAAESVVITDAQGIIQWVNPAFTRITGYSPDEAIGQTPRILKSGRHPLSFYESLWQHISSGRVWHGIFINRRKMARSTTTNVP